MKKLLVCLFGICFIMTGTFGNAFAENADTSFSYKILEDNTVSVTGVASTAGDLTILNVPSMIDGHEVSAISKRFYGSSPKKNAITQILLPETLQSIGYHAFSYCTNLGDVWLNRQVSTIEAAAFLQTAMDRVVILNPNCQIGDYSLGYLQDTNNPQQIVGGGPYIAKEGFTVFGYAGSTAESYAQNNGFAFVDLSTLQKGALSHEGEGRPDITDCLKLLRYSVGQEMLDSLELFLGDYDQDGKITTSDVRRSYFQISGFRGE